MRIGILTLPLHTNIGGVLQCYALQTVLQRMGHEVYVLNREFGYPSFTELLNRLGSFVKCLIKVLVLKRKDIRIVNPFALSYYPSYPVCDNSPIENFAHKYVRQTKAIRSSKKLWKYVQSHDFECLIVGSDQVWRESYSPCITDYFFGFLPSNVKIKKIAYAVSFGTRTNPISSLNIRKCIKLAGDFDYISVRETESVNVMKTVFGLEVTHVLDPTLLLDSHDYVIFEKENVCSELQTYLLDRDEVIDEIVDYIAERKNFVRADISTVQIKDTCVQPSVEYWLSALRHSKFIVTNSFHGCVFSILFKKDFIVILNGKRGAGRFYSLLDAFGLRNRLITGMSDLRSKEETLFKSIDYASVFEKYDKMKAYSLTFLRDALAD